MDPAGATATIGGTTLSAGLADSQAQLDQALGIANGFGSDSIGQFAAAYRSASGGPVLQLLGFNPFQAIATGAFHQLYWAAVVLFLGIMAVIALQHVLNNRYSVRGRHPLNGLVQIYFRLFIGVLMIANLPLLYGGLMTINHTLTAAVQAISTQSLGALLQSSGTGTLTLAQARADAIRQAAARRAIALYPNSASRAEMVAIGTWYNAAAAAVNARLAADQLPGALPTLDASPWNDAATADDQVMAGIGRGVVQNFGALLAALGAIPASESAVSLASSAGSSSLALLSATLQADDTTAAQALSLPSVPSSIGAFESARALYAKQVLAHTLGYLDTVLLPSLGESPTLVQRVHAWFGEAVEHAAAAATGGLLSSVRAGIDWLGRSIGVVLTRMVAFCFNFGTAALIELDLFILVLAMPLWLLPATEEAFHGALRSLGALAVAAPAYQFLMLFVDSLMGLVLKYLLLGPLAAGPTSVLGATGGAAYGAAAMIAIVGSGGEIVVLVGACYLCAYVFLAIYLAFKTPRIVGAFLKGAGAAGEFLSAFATGAVAGAATAFAAGSVAAGGSISARWLQQAAGNAAPSAPRSAAVPTGPLVAQSVAARRGAWSAAAKFGARTFAEALTSKSAGDGFGVAMDALADFRKQQNKEAATEQKAAAAAEKTAAKAAQPAAKRRSAK